MAKKTAEASLFTVEDYKANFKVNKKGKKEESIQIAICEYLKLSYPNVIFTCDLASGMKLPIWIAAKHKKMRSSRGLPDLFIAHQKKTYGNVFSERVVHTNHGLFLELKKDGSSPFLKDGSLSKDKHVQEQNKILQQLILQGYKAEFAVGYDHAVEIIDEYLSAK